MEERDLKEISARVIASMGLGYEHASRAIEHHIKSKVSPEKNLQTYREGIHAAFVLSHLGKAFEDASMVIANDVEDE